MAKYELQPDPFGDRSPEACASYTAMQADYSSALLLAAAVNEVRPRRLDVVLAAPAVRAAFADMWPALAAPTAY